MKKLQFFLGIGTALLLLNSCLSTEQRAADYIFTSEEKPLYPAVYQSLISGSEKYKAGFAQTPFFQSCYIRDADIYANTFDIADMYTIDLTGGVLGALTSSSGTGYYYFDFHIKTADNEALRYTYSNVRLETQSISGKKVLNAKPDLPSKGASGIPTIVNFFNKNIAEIMGDKVRYEEAKTAALSDPEFLIAVLSSMTELQRANFFKTELSQVTPNIHLKLSDVQENDKDEFSTYKYKVSSYYYPQYRLFLGDNAIRITLYTNDEKVTKLSKDMEYDFTGKVISFKKSYGRYSLVIAN